MPLIFYPITIVIIFINLEVIHIMYIVVVIRAMVSSVELFVLMLIMFPLLIPGIVVPLYHLNHMDDSVRARRFIVIIFIQIEVILVMLLVVVTQALVYVVGLSLLLLTVLLLLLHGFVAPPYHLNQIDDSLCEGGRRFIVIIFLKIEAILIIMLIAVVSRAMVISAERFVLLLTAVPLMPTGLVAPPYHLNQL